ncbi:MAG: acyltransferase [Ponticaulis sp.]|nr:acyltransferase [Ponticaulis sp.]
MRLVFAGMVAVYHMVALSLSAPGVPEERLASLAEVSIQGFFVLSGALVFGSLLRTDGISAYAMKRIRRLYPAYLTVILISAIAALALVPEPREHLNGVLHYILANAVFLNFLGPDLPGVFEEQRFTAVNGALWTIKIEVMFYIVLPILVWFLNLTGKLRLVFMALIYIAAEIWRGFLEAKGLASGSGMIIQLSRQLPGQMSFFIAGMLVWEYRDLLRSKWFIALTIGVILTGVSYLPYAEAVRAAGLALLIGAIGLAPGPQINAARFGDISYGVYITHFPIIQTVIAVGLFQTSVATGYAASAFATVMAAFLLWHLIEKPFLSRDNWYRRHEKGDQAT